MYSRKLFNYSRYQISPFVKSLNAQINAFKFYYSEPPQSFKYSNFCQQQRYLGKVCNNNSYGFSTTKKTTKNPQKKVFKLMKSQMIPKLNIFMLYDGQKQQKSFQWISGLFLLIFGLSLVKTYYTQDQFRKDDYIVLFVIVGSFIVYQRRILQTLKRVTLNSRGDKLSITTFNLLAKGERTLEAPVEIMTGIFRATRFGGNILKGGGKQSSFKQMKFWFSKQYITDLETFEYVVKGKSPKMVDQYQTL